MSTIRYLAACLLASTIVVAAWAADDAATQPVAPGSTWILLELTDDGHSEIVSARPAVAHIEEHSAYCGPEDALAAPAVAAHPHPAAAEDHHGHRHTHRFAHEFGEDAVVVTYDHPTIPTHKCHIPMRNPRKLYHDRERDDGGSSWAGGLHHLEKAHFAVTLHNAISSFHVKDMKNPHRELRRHYVTQEHHAAFRAQQVQVDTSTIQVDPVQLVGPLAQQPSLVFIASGYLASQQAAFNTKVQELALFLQATSSSATDKVNPKPYSRYYSTFNIWKIFHPSKEEGASHPLPAGDGKTVTNNLDCSYGANSYRILTCTRAKVLLVGSYAPPPSTRALYIVLVNDALFGGTGGGRICSVYAGDRMPVVLIHELGHALADLSDEYDYGVEESKAVPLLNCHAKQEDPPWNAWILSGIMPRPTPVCTYTNYFKPTPSSCLMESEQPTMCPVCAQNVVTTLYADGMNLASPRYPGVYETVYVKNGDSISLFINNRIPYLKDDSGIFDVAWTVSSTRYATGQHGFGFTAPNGTANYTGYTYNGVGDYTVTVTISDRTNMLLAADRNRLSVLTNSSSVRQVHDFRITVYNPATSTPGCTDKVTPYTTVLCVKCDSGREQDCGLSFTSTPIEKAYDVDAKLTGLEDWLLGIGGFFIALGLIAFGLIWKSMQLHHENTIREILPLTPTVKVFRILLMITQVLLLLVCSVCIVFAVYMFALLSVFGRTVIIGILAVAVVVWFCSFIGFCAAYYKNRSVMFFNFVLLLLLFGCALLFTSLLLYMWNNIDTDGVRNQLHAEWKRGVASSPAAACTLQSVLKCSGFNTSCITVNTPVGTADCPANCEVTNGIGFPCFLRLREFVLAQFFTAAMGGIVFCIFMLIALILSLVVGCGVKRNKVHVTRLRHTRAERGESTLSSEEVEMLQEEFNKIDRDKSNDISREEFALFYNQVMGAKLNPRQLEEYFDKLDSDQSGTLSFQEFIKVYVPQKKPKKRTLREAKSVIYQPGDVSAEVAAEIAADISAEPHEMPNGSQHSGTVPSSAQSQRAATRQPDIELDLIIDDDDLPDVNANEEAIRLQEEKAREDAAKIAQAQAERQKRLALDRPSNIDVELVMGDLGNLGGGATGAEQNLDGFENMDLDFDLDE